MRGLNLPATQGTSNAGNFLPGVHRFDYSAKDLDKVRQNRFNALRLPVNVSTASDRSALLKMRNVFETLGGAGILCFFEESSDPAAAPHGKGCADVAATSAAWRQAHEVFADSKVLYEIFNEPFGYEKPELYLYDMLLILHHAQLPLSRCVLDGKGYADDIRVLHRLGWNGFLAYHFYPNWLPEGHRSEDAYEQKVLQDVSEVADRAFITEFGAALNLSREQQAGQAPSEDAQCLRGLAAAVRQLPKLRGAFHWHGWGNGDTYDFGAPPNELGSDLVQAVLEGCGIQPLTSGTDAEPVALFRKGEMTYLVLLSDARFPHMPGWGWTFERIACYCWREATAPADAVPVHCWRNGEAALYGIASYEPAALACGFAFESVAFYAVPPSASPPSELSAVHEWRKEEMTYYARDDWEGYGSLPSWGWTHHRVAFWAPLA